MKSKDFDQRFLNTLLLGTPPVALFYGLKLSLKGVPPKRCSVPVAKDFEKYLQRNLIFKKVRHTVGASQKLKSPIFVFGIYVYRCRPTFSEYLSVAVFNKPSYLWEKNNAYTVILGCKVRIQVLLLTLFFIAFIIVIRNR